MLEKLSILFGTKNINIGSLTMQDQYYPVNDPDAISIIGINNISCWPELNDNNDSSNNNDSDDNDE